MCFLTSLADVVRVLGCAQAGVAGSDDGLSSIGDLQFGEDPGHVVAHGFRRQHETLGDGGVALALADELEDLSFAVAQLGESLFRA